MTTSRSDAAGTEPVRDDLLRSLRGWQKDAYHEYFRLWRRDFLLVATPGAGKTTYALTVAAELLARREVASLTIVTPTEHLKHQWAQAASRFGIAIDSAYRNAQGRAGADFAGVAVTYAQVAAHPALHRQRTQNRRTLVIFDEIHHAGDALSWGDAVKEAFEVARRRLALTGTPFRSDANPIPFVTYTSEPGGGRRSASDYVLRLRARPGGQRGPAGDLPGLLRRDALAHPGRGRDHRYPGHADDQGPDRAGLADRPGSGGGVGQPGARGRRQAADRGAPRHARRGRPGHRGRPRGRPGLRRPAARADR